MPAGKDADKMLNINDIFFMVNIVVIVLFSKKGAGGMIIVVNVLRRNTLLGLKYRIADLPCQGQKAKLSKISFFMIVIHISKLASCCFKV